MKTSYRFILFALFLLILLCGANIYIALKNQRESSKNITQAINTYREENKLYTSNVVKQAVEAIQVKNGVDGKDGQNGTNGKDGATTVTHEYTEPPQAKDGVNGKDGTNARQVVLGTDPDSGDIVWKYAGDTLWNLLLEKCSLTNSCSTE